MTSVRIKAKELVERQRAFDAEVRKEFRVRAYTGLTAALALVIALSWQEPIQLTAKAILRWLSLPTDGIFAKVIVAIVITLAAAMALVMLNHWANRKQ